MAKQIKLETNGIDKETVELVRSLPYEGKIKLAKWILKVVARKRGLTLSEEEVNNGAIEIIETLESM